ncbi:hypothetical protein ILUMI_16148, partial [Ignelater luminosus]
TDVSETQFGFRRGLGAQETLFTFNLLVQRCLDVNQDVYACFIDYNKALDEVRHDELMNIVKDKHLDHRDLMIISNLYYKQRATICIDQQTSEEMEIRNRV